MYKCIVRNNTLSTKEHVLSFDSVEMINPVGLKVITTRTYNNYIWLGWYIFIVRWYYELDYKSFVFAIVFIAHYWTRFSINQGDQWKPNGENQNH